MTVEQAARIYFKNNPTPYQNSLSEEGENLVEAVLKHEEVERVLTRLRASVENLSFVRIERNRRLGAGLGLRVEVEIPIELNQGAQQGLVATITMEVCAPDHPYYPGEVWGIRTMVETSDMENWPQFSCWEVILPKPELPTPVFIEPV